MGDISEDFYDGHIFPIDSDVNEFQYKLVSTVNHFTRSKVLYHQKVLQDKRKAIGVSLLATNCVKSKAHEDAKLLLVTNVECELKLINAVLIEGQYREGQQYITYVSILTTLENIYSCSESFCILQSSNVSHSRQNSNHAQ